MLSVGFCAAQFMEIFLGIWMFWRMSPQKREHSGCLKLMYIVSYIAWVMLCAWNTWMTFVSNSFIVVNSLVLSSWILIYLKSSYVTIFIWEFFYNTTIALFKMLLLILEGVLGQKRLGEVNWGNRNFREIVWCFILYFIVFIVISKIRSIQQILKIVLFEHRRTLGVVCCMEWCMLTYSMYLGMQGFSTTGFILHSAFVLCAVLVMLYLIWYVLYQQAKVEMDRIDTFQEILEKQNKTLRMIYNQNNKKMHDVKHVMLYLESCLEQGRTKDAQEQIHYYMNRLVGLERKVWTGFPFFDFILNYKKAEMDEKKISFKLEVDLYDIPLEEAELGIVLGNLFDNAIEAAGQCELKRRNIYLKVGNMNQMFLLHMRNSSTKKPQLKNNNFLTTKKDSFAHGLGVESVKHIVEKQNGKICFQYDKEYFEVTILI
jgi:hypothetical protein